MTTMLLPFIGKDCIIKTLTDTLVGTLTDVSENGLIITTKETTAVLNLDYVVSVKEHPLTKKGKKKSIIWD